MGAVFSAISNVSKSFGNLLFLIAIVCLITFGVLTWIVSGFPFNPMPKPNVSTGEDIRNVFLLAIAIGFCIPTGLIAFIGGLVWNLIGYVFGNHEQPTKTILQK